MALVTTAYSAFGITFWVFVSLIAITLAVFFALALSRLQDTAVIAVGAITLVAAVVLVTLQGLQVRGLLDARAAMDIADSGYVPDPDASVVRSYSLVLRPDHMLTLAPFKVSDLAASGVQMTETAFVKCGNTVSTAEVSFATDAQYFVVSHGASSGTFHSDVVSGMVSTIMISGALLRIVALTSLDFPGDVNHVASTISATCDMYLLSARGSAGSSVVDTSSTCSAMDIYMPWSWQSSFVNTSATTTMAAFTSTRPVQQAVPVQVWGIGGR